MRVALYAILAAAILAFATPAFADLQNTTVDGSLRLRGNWYSSEAVAQPRNGGRPFPPVIGPSAPFGIGNYQFEEDGNSNGFVEMRSTLGILADFTNDVSLYTEFDSYEIWGTSLRDGIYIATNGVSPDAGPDDVDLYQAYIEMREAWGYPLTIRIGRQEIMLGSEWLVGNNDTAAGFTGLSFDGVTARYDADVWSVTGAWLKLAETGFVEEDGDTDLYAIYASYTGFEDWVVDAYWIFVRDAAAPIKATGVGIFNFDVIEDIFGVDQFDDTTNLHTIGLRGVGTYGQFDFEGEIAYQTGEATGVIAGNAISGFPGFLNPDPNSLLGSIYGDDDADFDNFGLNVEVGYTFDTNYQPRVYLGVAFFEGEDERDDSFGDFIRSLFPFSETDSSVSFNRLFSDWEYSEFLSNTDLSNALIIRGGVSADLTESVEVSLALSYFQADEATTTNGFLLGFPAPAFFGEDSDDDLGVEVGLYLTYQYSEDLSFDFGYAHFFADDGVDNNNRFLSSLIGPIVGGNFVGNNGNTRVGGYNDDDADYVFIETKISF
jgi:hypothetical protein